MVRHLDSLDRSSAFERMYSRSPLLQLPGNDARVVRADVGIRRSCPVWEPEAGELIAVDEGKITDSVGMVVVQYPGVGQ